ncbi:MAG: DUF1727 domain-containing protein [Clostridia bacterium]|nr:DUF1727 domain-containing protein [Clostridia bacterium]
MFFLALIVGKILNWGMSLLGRGSAFPGRIALRLYPDLLKRIRINGTIIAVTGSNGKTTTTNMLVSVLRKLGKKVCTNSIGSNMTDGVATVLLRAATLGGTVNTDYLVLEVDERYSRLIFRDFKPNYLLVTNLFRDQITRNNNVDFIYSILDGIITPEIRLILNAMDPISVRLGGDNPRVYFGCAQNDYTTPVCLTHTNDCKVCPKCKRRLSYDYYLYNHIGMFRCEHCGFASPEMHHVMSRPDLEAGTFFINGFEVHTSDATVYNMMNMTAAFAACVTAGLPEAQVAAALNDARPPKTRFAKFKAGDREGVMILSKNQNPVSFDLSIGEVVRMKGEKTVVAYINNINHTLQKDITWLWDIAFDRLVGNADNVICAGPRALDLAVVLRHAGYDMDRVVVQPELSGMKEAVARTRGTICVLTELYDAKKIMSAIQ